MIDPVLGHDDLEAHRPRGDINGDADQLDLVTRIIHALVDTGLMYVDGDSLRRLSGLACQQHYGYSPDCDRCEVLMDLAATELAKQLGPDIGTTE
jgi:hypothetical protein